MTKRVTMPITKAIGSKGYLATRRHLAACPSLIHTAPMLHSHNKGENDVTNWQETAQSD